MFRFDILRVRRFKERFNKFTGNHFVLIEMHVILFPVELGNIQISFIRPPRNVCEIMIPGFAGLQKYRLTALNIIDTNRYLMTRHSGHGVFDHSRFCLTLHIIDQRIIFHHRLVLSVKSQVFSGRRPKGPFSDAKLIAVYNLTVHDAGFQIMGNLYSLRSFPAKKRLFSIV